MSIENYCSFQLNSWIFIFFYQKKFLIFKFPKVFCPIKKISEKLFNIQISKFLILWERFHENKFFNIYILKISYSVKNILKIFFDGIKILKTFCFMKNHSNFQILKISKVFVKKSSWFLSLFGRHFSVVIADKKREEIKSKAKKWFSGKKLAVDETIMRTDKWSGA